MIRNRYILKGFALFFSVQLLVDAFAPSLAHALTSGPVQPEYASFEPVATTDMVELFSGDFTYNLPVLSIPGPEGAGYDMSLSYHSGINSEMDASWVGLGWTLNPGAINRQTQGYPDDYKKVPVKQYNKVRPNWTVVSGKNVSVEYYSQEREKRTSVNQGPKKSKKPVAPTTQFQDDDFDNWSGSASYETTVRFNNYRGYMRSGSIGSTIDFKGVTGGLRMNRAGSWASGGGESTVGANISLGKYFLKKFNKHVKTRKGLKPKNKKTFKRFALRVVKRAKSSAGSAGIGGSHYNLFNLSSAQYSVSQPRFMGVSYSHTATFQVNPAGHFGGEAGMDVSSTLKAFVPENDYEAFGYMYNPQLSDVEDASNQHQGPNGHYYTKVLTDHTIEKASPFQQRKEYMGVPFNNADNYVVSGEGVGGGFRMYQQKVGHYYAAPSRNRTRIIPLGWEFGVGTTLTAGLDVGYGEQNLSSGPWSRLGDTEQIQFEADPPLFRFSNDLAGSLGYSSVTDAQSAEVVDDAGIGVRYAPALDQGVGEPSYVELNNVSAADLQNSSTILYTLNSEIANQENALDKSLDIWSAKSESKGAYPDRIAEFATVNASGQRYVYGLPVYARNEERLQFLPSSNAWNTTSGDVKNILRHDSNVDMDNLLSNTEVTGEVREGAYASAYLLTQITSPNYVDLGDLGPDAADFGAWVKFRYRTPYGYGTTPSKWYTHRSPYTGFHYSKGSIGDSQDDDLTVTRGEREVHYLKCIETKTHIAFFVTNQSVVSDFEDCVDASFIAAAGADLNGSASPRYDGYGANRADGHISDEKRDSGQKLEMLERIVLFAKTRPEKPMQTVNFDYDYELCQGTPNSRSGEYGKLTLKKVWFEYEGVARTRIAPYQFEYQKAPASNFSTALPAEYDDVIGRGTANLLHENPDFGYGLDPWGDYQPTGEDRAKKLNPWVDQKDHNRWDGAPWTLKQIHLPSGGQIHIQYEPKDYQYVQDRRAMAMVELDKLVPHDNNYTNDNRYYIDVASLGYGASETDDLLAALREHYHLDPTTGLAYPMLETEYVYFKFLYDLEGDGLNQDESDLDRCNVDYVMGYAPLREIGKVGNNIYFGFGPTDEMLENGTGLFDGDSKRIRAMKNMVPRKVGFDYLLYNRAGKAKGDCYPNLQEHHEASINAQFETVTDDNELASAINDFGFGQGTLMAPAWELSATFGSNGDYDYNPWTVFKNPRPQDVCEDLNNEFSYIRIPVLNKAKKGGGARVKRILMYDPGIEVVGDANNADAALYGSTYHYELADGTSSGVATNEPPGAREENPLVNVIRGKEQSWWNKIRVGTIDADMEGPIGETILPGASVGHSRVVVENIHRGTTANGYAVHQYFTVKDAPFDGDYDFSGERADFTGKAVDYTDLSDNTKRTPFNLPKLGILNYSRNKAWSAQGFRFVQHNMHGQPKMMATYPGTYAGAVNDEPVSQKEYEYFHPGEKVPVAILNEQTGAIEVSYENPGKELDVAMYMESISDRTIDVNVELDIDFNLPFLAGGFSFMPSITFAESEISTHANSKVVRYPIMLKSVRTVVDGAESFSENLAFNSHTGGAIVTRTVDAYDGLSINGSVHDGSVYAFSMPGSWVYPELGPKSADPNNTNQLGTSVGSVVMYQQNPLVDSDSDGKYDRIEFPNSGVLAASAITLKKDWFVQGEHDEVDAAYNVQNADRAELNRFYYPYQNYVFDTDRTSSDQAVVSTNRIFEQGVFDSFAPFKWDNVQASEGAGWIKASEVLHYSPHGQPLEEEDALGINSTVRFGYGNQLPVLVAANASYNNVLFEDFENVTGTSVDLNVSHSGARSRNFTGDYPWLPPGSATLSLDQQLDQKGAVVRVWLRSIFTDLTNDNPNPNFRIETNGGTTTPFAKVAQTGEWSLYEAHIFDWGTATVGDPIQLRFLYDKVQGQENLWLDDIRFQPREAQATCYVYDPVTFRLLTQFGDQHFGVYYQYDLEGKLVRQLIETERGMKTLQETQYNTPRNVQRPN